MQGASATTSIGARLRSQFMVNAQQQRCELRVFNEGMAHWSGLFFLVEKETLPQRSV
ncbi:hypothetical protein [Hydrogenophaga sp. IBVHS1]|jgi:hypothetical protein|uniref:hypothetical protein n=1 Tax=unclassified Hydrogenophaga TaxID=2610897 RepID=UPI0015C4F1AD|nr:hypothetical protein [Hydrogenophaga sp. IBVHS1]HVL10556.1 hypothetical protein [Burkholderiaceae bacterium]